MATAPTSPTPSGLPGPLQHELARYRKEWWWFFLLGLLMVVAGIVAVSHAFLATNVAVQLFGILLVVCGGVQLVSAFWSGQWSGFLLTLLIAILYIVMGGLMMARPVSAAGAITLLLGAFFLVGGIFRIVASLALKFHHWGWPLLNGVITAFLGAIILGEWPESSLFVIGLFIGIDLIFNGWAWVMLSLGVRAAPQE